MFPAPSSLEEIPVINMGNRNVLIDAHTVVVREPCENLDRAVMTDREVKETSGRAGNDNDIPP